MLVSSWGVDARQPGRVLLGSADGSQHNPLNSYTFTDTGIGPPAPSRKLIALIRAANSNISTSGDITNVQLDDVDLTRQFTSKSGFNHWTIWTLPWPTGKTGTLVIRRTTGNGFDFAFFSLFAAYNLLIEPPLDVQGGITTSGNPLSLVNPLQRGGISVAMAYAGSVSSFAWNKPFIKTSEQQVGVSLLQTISSAVLDKQAGAGTREGDYIATATNDTDDFEMIAASFR